MVDVRIKAIEKQALTMGWTADELWRRDGMEHQWGLVMLLGREDTISEVTAEYIEIRRPLIDGFVAKTRFWNQRVSQPWAVRE